MSGERYQVRVCVPGFRRYRGFSDLVETHCCSATSCYYVEFPSIGYEGYFQKTDVEVMEVKKSSQGKENYRSKKP